MHLTDKMLNSMVLGQRKSIPNSATDTLRPLKHESREKPQPGGSRGTSGRGSIFSPLPVPSAVPPFRKKGTSEPSSSASEKRSESASIEVPETPQAKQRSRRVAAPPAQARAGRYLFSQGYGRPLLRTTGRGQPAGRFPYQIISLIYAREVFATKFKLPGCAEFQLITQIDGLEYGLNIVVPIRVAVRVPPR